MWPRRVSIFTSFNDHMQYLLGDLNFRDLADQPVDWDTRSILGRDQCLNQVFQFCYITIVSF